MSNSKKKLLLVLRRAPYGDPLARASLDVALAAAAFEQDVQLLFMDDGVWQLLPAQEPAQLALKSMLSTLRSMPLYDLETFHVDAASLQQRQLQAAQLDGNINLLAADQLPVFLDGFDQVLGF
jgi:tRNA 2-thiouridine synthesizing protein C